MKQFLAHVIDDNIVDCDRFKTVFLETDGRWKNPDDFEEIDDGGTKWLKGSTKPLNVVNPADFTFTASPAQFKDSRLQSLFNELPNKFNNAFIGMSKSVNTVKGCVFNPKCAGMQRPKISLKTEIVDMNLNYWNDL